MGALQEMERERESAEKRTKKRGRRKNFRGLRERGEEETEDREKRVKDQRVLRKNAEDRVCIHIRFSTLEKTYRNLFFCELIQKNSISTFLQMLLTKS